MMKFGVIVKMWKCLFCGNELLIRKENKDRTFLYCKKCGAVHYVGWDC
jgi:transcription elongation factor Elf1